MVVFGDAQPQSESTGIEMSPEMSSENSHRSPGRRVQCPNPTFKSQTGDSARILSFACHPRRDPEIREQAQTCHFLLNGVCVAPMPVSHHICTCSSAAKLAYMCRFMHGMSRCHVDAHARAAASAVLGVGLRPGFKFCTCYACKQTLREECRQ